MRLSQILPPDEILSLEKPTDFSVGRPLADSRKIEKQDIFFCEDGFHESGFSYIERALAQGASAIVTHRGGARRIGKLPIPILEVEDVRKSYALAWSRHEGHPENRLRLFAVTGTNGKTSVSCFLSELIRRAGIGAGLIGTVAFSDGVHSEPSDYTTPPPDILYPMLSEIAAKNTIAVMEASSHAISQNRLYGLHFETAIFTSLSRDHLDYHKTWEAYRDTKASLFARADNAVINLDDAAAKHMGFAANGDVYYYGQSTKADFRIRNPICDANGIRYILQINEKNLPVQIPIVGNFHIYNSAAAIAAAFLAGSPEDTLVNAAETLSAPPGRLEKLSTNTDFSVYIDYAHSPDALTKALISLRPFTKKLTVLFGAGGERDRGKRPEMGAAAEVFADFAIVTSDNPRGESPAAIIDDIERGMKRQNHIRIEDRESAIVYAITHAEPGEIILLAGKGHETYTISGDGKHTFSERNIVHRILNEQRKGKDHVPKLE